VELQQVIALGPHRHELDGDPGELGDTMKISACLLGQIVPAARAGGLHLSSTPVWVEEAQRA